MNPQKTDKGPSYAEILHEIVSAADGPILTEALAAQMLEKHPSTAKNPHKAVLEKIRAENGKQLVYLDPAHVLPLRLVYQGVRYRIRLTKEIIDQGALPLDSCFRSYLPIGFRLENISFVDSEGTPIPAQIIKSPHTTTFSLRAAEYQSAVVVLKEWFRPQKMYAKDHILVTIEDWERGVFRLERERFGEQRSDLLAERNRYFADTCYALLEAGHYQEVFVYIVLPTIYAKMPDKNGYPLDHWAVIIANDSRMVNRSGFSIGYAGSFSMMDKMLADMKGQSLRTSRQQYPKEEGQQIYRLRAELKNRPSIWREIEIKGKQTLTDLDNILRTTFQHDSSDHLSGFWQKIARGGSRNRYREIDLGTVNPYEAEEGSDTQIASLKLKAGDQLKYVYDFGDWVEHTLELKSIIAPEKGVNYPREVARNKVKPEYCVECQKKGVQTTATWACHTCSEEEDRDILLCEACFKENDDHEEHYVVEILY